MERTAAAFIVGAIAGAVMTEAGVCMCYPGVKKSMMRSGKRMVRRAMNMGEKMFD